MMPLRIAAAVFLRWGTIVFALVAAGPVKAAETRPPWLAMDYGPFLSTTVQVPGSRTNIAYKGIAIRLGDDERQATVLFDTDLLRYAGAWTEGFLALKGIAFDGEHWEYPRVEGRLAYSNPQAPGWAVAGGFDDPREVPYGPLPRETARWGGLYLHGSRVILEYRVGSMSVLESPRVEWLGADAVFIREMELGPDGDDHVVQLAQVDGTPARWIDHERRDAGADDRVSATIAVQSLSDGRLLAMAVVEPGGQTSDDALRWQTDAAGSVRLRIRRSDASRRLSLLAWAGEPTGLRAFIELVRRARRDAAPESLRGLTRGGPPRWDETFTTRARTAGEEGALAIDEIPAPENPWRSWMRFGALDILPDGRHAVITTWNGDVWMLSGIEGDLQAVTWRRIATGLFQPLGIVFMDGAILVLGRDQITRLHDLNGDGEADYYENFNNDGYVSEHFHEFATDLKIGPDGDLYYLKCARHALPAVHPHHGTLIRVSRDGRELQVVAGGFRAVNGLGIWPDGTFSTVDNQGHWMPANRINHVVPGGWYGNQWAWNADGRTSYDPPLCWIHNSVDRSGGTHLWVPRGSWGPLAGEMITLSYGMGRMFLVMRQSLGDRMQGAVTPLPAEFETGVMRGVFHPGNGHLYACGLFGWAGNKTRPGGLYRVRHTGRPMNVVKGFAAVPSGLTLEFTDPLDPASASDPGNWNLKAWNYRWSSRYGSPDLRSDGTEGRDTWSITAVEVSPDGRTVHLRVPEIRPVMQWHLAYDVRSASGDALRSFVHGTIHELGRETESGRPPSLAAGSPSGRARPEVTAVEPGLVQSLESAGGSMVDRRVTRLAAMHVPGGGNVSALLGPAPFVARWQGFLNMDLNTEARFELEGRGHATLRIEGIAVAGGDLESGVTSGPVPLRSGLNEFELEWRSPSRGDAVLRLLWTVPGVPREPVPPGVFAHDPATAEVGTHAMVRRGREIFAERRCIACHSADDLGMPELAMDAPSFHGIGSRLREDWMTRWILDPSAVRPQARMPRLVRGDDAETRARDIAAFLAGLRDPGADNPEGTMAGADRAAEGRRLFMEHGCVACHAEPGARDPHGREPLHGISTKWKPVALAEYLQNPRRHFAWTRMPDFGLGRSDAEALASWLFAADAAAGVGARGRADRGGHAPGDPVRGRQLAEAAGCFACHAMDGARPVGAGVPLAEVARGDWSRGCMGTDPDDRSPDFRFSAEEREALRALREFGVVEALRGDAPAEFAERQIHNLRCHACHVRDGRGDLLGELLRGSAVDPEESGDHAGSVHGGRPSLTFAGEKLRADWTRRLLEGVLPYKPRPDLQGRMPAFPAFAAGLAEGMAHQHGFGREAEPAAARDRPGSDPDMIEVGRALTGGASGFGCVTCHGVGSQAPLAGADTATVNFAVVADRLRHGYYWRYVQDPGRVMPGTMMPKFIQEDGTTALQSVLKGDAERQFAAIWEYLQWLASGGAGMEAAHSGAEADDGAGRSR